MLTLRTCDRLYHPQRIHDISECMARSSLAAQWAYVMARVLRNRRISRDPDHYRRVQTRAIPQNGLWQPTDGSSTLLIRYWTTVSTVLTPYMTEHGGAPDTNNVALRVSYMAQVLSRPPLRPETVVHGNS